MGLLFKNFVKKVAPYSSLFTFGKKVVSSREFQESLIKFCFTGLVILCLLHMNLNYLINILQPHCSICDFLSCCCSIVSSWKYSFFFQLWKWRALFTSFTHPCKHPIDLPCRNDTVTWKKSSLKRRASSCVKARSRLSKTSRLAGRNNFTCKQK